MQLVVGTEQGAVESVETRSGHWWAADEGWKSGRWLSSLGAALLIRYASALVQTEMVKGQGGDLALFGFL